MKRHRGFRLGRCLGRVWRRLFRRRHKHYLRLDRAAGSFLQSSRLSQTSKTTSKFRHWGLLLTRRFRRNQTGAEATLLAEEPEGGPTPKGHLAVYVGCERYTVPVIYFNHPLFGELLREAEEEFGFHHTGGITLPCPTARFEDVRNRIAADSDRSRPQVLLDDRVDNKLSTGLLAHSSSYGGGQVKELYKFGCLLAHADRIVTAFLKEPSGGIISSTHTRSSLKLVGKKTDMLSRSEALQFPPL
ncbi:hypothetical protein ZIOFF_041746 [Zingiber officinale]|uniref:SAUR family protein n=1 Tax=Zingiber officinale TaxID=94328 RepID=A0A8J5GE40_ZINOF|nr:hypothetical protein ZIOFF_041746 [Zingiber officinale]